MVNNCTNINKMNNQLKASFKEIFSFYLWRKSRVPRQRTTYMPGVTDKYYHIKFYQVHLIWESG